MIEIFRAMIEKKLANNWKFSMVGSMVEIVFNKNRQHV
jgi:hypothetical protein